MRSNCRRRPVKTGLAACRSPPRSGAALAQSSVTLTAGPTSATLPDGQSGADVGLHLRRRAAAAPASTATCTAMNGSAQSGTAWQPPLITVPSGQPLTINLINNLAFGGGANTVPTSLVIVGQLGGGLGDARSARRCPAPTHAPQGTTWPGTGHAGRPAPAGATPMRHVLPAGTGDRVRSFAPKWRSRTSAARRSTWSNAAPRHLPDRVRHAAVDPGPMGLYGVLVVTEPDDTRRDPGTGLSGMTYDADVAAAAQRNRSGAEQRRRQAVQTRRASARRLVWNGQPGECGDPAPRLHTCYPPAVNYSPLYYLINGVSFDKTNCRGSLFCRDGARRTAATGQRAGALGQRRPAHARALGRRRDDDRCLPKTATSCPAFHGCRAKYFWRRARPTT